MTIKTFTTALGFTLFGALLATGAGALAGGRHGDDRRERLEQLLQDLDLSETQKADARELRGQIREQRQGLHADRQARAEDLAKLLSAKKLDRGAVHDLVHEGLDAREKVADQITDEVLDFYATLEPEQQKVIVDRLGEFASAADE